MTKKIIKDPMFIIGFGFIFLLFMSSIVYHYVWHDYQPEVTIEFDENGKVTAIPPHSPLEQPPLGTDRKKDIFANIIIGAKYTLGIAFLVAILRFIFASLFGLTFGFYFYKWSKWLTKVVDSLHYFPVVILSYLLLYWVLLGDGQDEVFTYNFTERIAFEVVILTIIAVPITTQLISNETNRLLRKEYIEASRTMGGRSFHIFKKHVLPALIPQFIIIFSREVIQVLILLSHLGVLGIFIGGGESNDDRAVTSLSNEWSGLIGDSLMYIHSPYKWIPLMPVLFFALSMIAMKLIILALERNITQERPVLKQIEDKEQIIEKKEPKDSDFKKIFINKRAI